MSKSAPKGARDNRANQLNPAHPLYWRSRGASPGDALSRAEHSRRPATSVPELGDGAADVENPRPEHNPGKSPAKPS